VTTFRIAHLSDPHLPPPPAMRRSLRDIFSKRTLSRLAWRRKRNHHSPAVLADLVADLHAQRPDHIALTGDLTNFSTPEELAAARRWLEDLAPPEQLTVSPGNHDALIAAEDDRFAPWRPWLGDEPNAGFPAVRVRGPVALINLCSATPTALHLAQGRLGQDQIARLAENLRALGDAGLFRLVLVHHPIAAGAVSARKSLVDAEALRQVLQREGAELVLHGHAHEALTMQVPGPVGPIPVLGVPSASAIAGHGEAARWHDLAIARGAEGFVTEVIARGLGPEGAFAELGRYRLVSPRR
jgi:3',5'-cyclic AMP phosphodiesterase CpdA